LFRPGSSEGEVLLCGLTIVLLIITFFLLYYTSDIKDYLLIVIIPLEVYLYYLLFARNGDIYRWYCPKCTDGIMLRNEYKND